MCLLPSHRHSAGGPALQPGRFGRVCDRVIVGDSKVLRVLFAEDVAPEFESIGEALSRFRVFNPTTCSAGCALCLVAGIGKGCAAGVGGSRTTSTSPAKVAVDPNKFNFEGHSISQVGMPSLC